MVRVDPDSHLAWDLQPRAAWRLRDRLHRRRGLGSRLGELAVLLNWRVRGLVLLLLRWVLIRGWWLLRRVDLSAKLLGLLGVALGDSLLWLLELLLLVIARLGLGLLLVLVG